MNFFQSDLVLAITNSLAFKITGSLAVIIALYFFWRKANLLKALFAALVNTVYGIALLSSLTADTPGQTIILVVAGALIGFGVWGFIIWTKTTVRKYQDDIAANEELENWWSTIRAFDFILIIGLVFRLFILQPFVVEGPSMNPNFQDKETIMVEKISTRFSELKRGEVVIFKAPPKPTDDYIKRVIGLPGETISIKQGKVYINGQLLEEKYLASSGQIPQDDPTIETTLGSNEYFVMGDNRPESSDSRSWGTITKEDLIGRAILAIYPFNMSGIIKNPQY